MSTRIEKYGLIGNTRSAALVGEGSIDWLCMPRFDSDACFSAILGTEEHGRWLIRPSSEIRSISHAYRRDSLSIETRFECDGGVLRVIDFMPVDVERDEIIRMVEAIEGEVPVELELVARFGYGADRPFIRAHEGAIDLTAGPDTLRLWSDVPCEIQNDTVRSKLTLRAGQRVAFTLAWRASHLAPRPPLATIHALRETDAFWSSWAARCTYQGPYREAVVRSLLTLKALTYAPTGGIVAAPTASLPEEIGGVRNWDYRFCWLRDAAITLDALLSTGYGDEAASWRDWLIRTVLGDPARIQIMYGISGERRLTEVELPWLPGYEGSKPVRIGNAASEQFQLDVYGEVLTCIAAAHARAMPTAPWAWAAAYELVEFVASNWSRPDDGIWEVRGGGRRHFTYSKAMAWAAMDRATRMFDEFEGGKGRDRLTRWSAVRDEIHREVLAKGFDPKQQAFTQSYGVPALDASVLLMPHIGFISGDDPRMVSTVRAIERQLMRDGYVRRYDTGLNLDGLAGDEGAFLACTFWLGDNYALQGRFRDAHDTFERLLALRNDLGLLSEEVETQTRRQIGNFPQAFTHLALVMSAVILERAETRKRTPGAVVTTAPLA